jgi:hypothetical protein
VGGGVGGVGWSKPLSSRSKQVEVELRLSWAVTTCCSAVTPQPAQRLAETSVHY